MSTEIKLNMVDNGLDFIANSLNTIEESAADLKYSLINLHAGIQLILKELLYQEHWSLIFQDIDKADKSKLDSGDFNSVSYDTLIKRLKNICDIEFDKELISHLDWLRKERNKTEHFQFVATPDVLKAKIVNLFTYLIPFIKSELIDAGCIHTEDQRFLEIEENLYNMKEYVQARLELIKTELSSIKLILQCPICNQEAVDFNGDTEPFCYFCSENIKNFGEQYIDNCIDSYSFLMNGGDSQLYECPECDQETFLCIDGEQFICLDCAIILKQEEITTCSGPICSERFLYRRNDYDDIQLCYDCAKYFRDN